MQRMNQLEHLVEKNLWLAVTLSIVIGFTVPQVSVFYPYVKEMLMFIVFLTALKLDFPEFKGVFASLPRVAAFYAAFFIVFPAVVFLIVRNLLPMEYALGLFVAFLMPAGVSTPAYADFLKGKIELSLFIVALTMFAAPFVVPAMLFLLTGKIASETLAPMFGMLATLLALPVAAAIVVRKFACNAIEKTRSVYSLVSLVAIILLIASSLAVTADEARAKAFSLALPVAFVIALFGAALFLGYTFVSRDARERVSFGLAAYYRNYLAAIVFTGLFLGTEAMLFVTMLQIPLDLTTSVYALALGKKQNAVQTAKNKK